jgi:dolichol-phosphate mannosyltransferase
MPVELLVVDDRSPDGTADVVAARFAHEPRVSVHVRDARGLAGAIRCGAEMARGGLLVFMDTDGNHDPAFVPALVEAAATAGIVVGSRFCPGGGMPTSRFRETCSRLFNRWACATLDLPVTDCLSGFLCVRRDSLEKADFDAVFVGYGDYAIHLLSWAARHGVSIAEVPVVYAPRRGGESKTRFFSILRDYYRTVMRLRREGLPRRRDG